MDISTVIWGICFPLLLFFVAVGVGTGFAMTNSDSVGFLVARACFAAAAFDCIAVAVYSAVASGRLPWNIILPTIVAAAVIPSLVLSMLWLDSLETKLSTHLLPGDEPIPVNIPQQDVTNGVLRVLIGTNVAIARVLPYTVLEMAGEKMIVIDKDKDQLVISMLKIFDDRNNIIARIDADDGFWVENSTRKKRPDKSTLVVYDHSDREVLRLNFLNPHVLSVSGTFRHARVRRPVTITPEHMEMNGNIFSQSSFGGVGIAIGVGADK